MLLEHDYIHADPPKSLPPIPVRVSRRSQLTAALRQHARPIVIEDQELAGPFVRLLRARQLRLWGIGEFVANTMSCGINRRGALLRGPICSAGERAKGDPQAKALRRRTTTATSASITIRQSKLAPSTEVL